MVARNPHPFKHKSDIEKRYEFGEVEVSLNDTVTFGSFDNSVALLTGKLYKKSDGTEMTTTNALNVLTVTGAGTNIDCLYIAWGYKA